MENRKRIKQIELNSIKQKIIFDLDEITNLKFLKKLYVVLEIIKNKQINP
ncbi:hypothetical protein IGJ34_002362 [Enterococcus sp. AZ177]